jgi:hypothetical protein
MAPGIASRAPSPREQTGPSARLLSIQPQWTLAQVQLNVILYAAPEEDKRYLHIDGVSHVAAGQNQETNERG